MSRDTPLQPDLDRAIEAGLRHQARSEPCPTMDVIAAYCEHSLAVEELTRWEDHFAGCRRCQQVLASVARVEPALQPVSAPSWSWRALDWRWLVPATAAAAAVTIWIAVRPAPSTVEGPAPSRAVPAITPPQVVAQRSEPAAEPQPPAAAAPAPSVVAAPVSQRPQELLSKPTEQAMPPPLAPAGRAVASA
ncbi:MAG: hypothetical protein HY654_12830, partial [Acidobacteria bacterium]|nr:hypothetical protein [Acidobacteriota bacterium]